MPSNAWRRSAGGLPLGALASLGSEYPRPIEHTIHTASWCAIGQDLVGLTNGGVFASGTFSSANRAVAVPFEIAHPFLVRKVFWFVGTTATTDSMDVGVYSEANTLLVSGGGTAVGAASSLQEVDVTDTLLQPGRYWLAYSQNGVTATPVAVGFSPASLGRVAGCAQMASAYPLPSTFVPAALSAGIFPICGISSRTLVA